VVDQRVLVEHLLAGGARVSGSGFPVLRGQGARLQRSLINYFLDEKNGYDNFVNWNGYQPPFTSIQPESLIADKVVPENLGAAVVTEDMFKKDLTPYELTPTVDQLWLDAWTTIKSGA